MDNLMKRRYWEGRCTANEERPQWSEDGGIVIPQSGESLGHPSVRDTIVVDVPSSCNEVSLQGIIDWGMDYRQSASWVHW